MTTLLGVATFALLLAPVQSLAEAETCSSQIIDNIDYVGYDLKRKGTCLYFSTAETYCEFCSAVKACNAFTWTQYEGGVCFMKSTTGIRFCSGMLNCLAYRYL